MLVHCGSVTRICAVIVVWFYACVAGGACRSAGAPALSAATALRRAFPEQVAQVLEESRAFVATARGFGVNPDEESTGATGAAALKAHLPRRGEGAISLPLGENRAPARVREVSANGEGILAERAVAYQRAGGISFWAATKDGIEEWLLLSPDAVRDDAPVAEWEVEGASLRAVGDAAEILDESGVPRIRVSAPLAYAEGGRLVRAKLRVAGARLSLWVEARHESVLVDPGWRFTEPMKDPRSCQAAAKLLDGRVLIVGGKSSNGAKLLLDAEIYDPQSHAFVPAGSLSFGRCSPTATTLQDGRVLVMGGHELDSSVSLDTAEVFEPKQGLFLPLSSKMVHARSGHTATMLPDGRVLVTGGRGPNALSSTEIFDPISNEFKAGGSMSVMRYGHTATMLNDGDVLVTGGDGANESLYTAELYDHDNDSFITVESMLGHRVYHTATKLPNGQVIIIGGEPTGTVAFYAEVYDPAQKKFSVLSQAIAGRSGHTATTLSDGRVLVAGGDGVFVDVFGKSTAARDIVEIYDPQSNGFRRLGPTSSARAWHTATALDDGRVLIVGDNLETAEIFDDKESSFTQAASMNKTRVGHTATKLPDESVLLVGGRYNIDDNYAIGNTYNDIAEIYYPSSDKFVSIGPAKRRRAGHTATLLLDNAVLIAGGSSEINDNSAEIYRNNAFVFTKKFMIQRRTWHSATLLSTGKVLIAGGLFNNDALRSAELYDPISESFTEVGSLNEGRMSHTATLLSGDRVLFVGGYNKDREVLSSIEIFDPVDKKFIHAGSVTYARAAHTATLLANDQVLVAGGQSSKGAISIAEIF
ncbi:MAG: kelch repeat-containing protein [Byssovorax sp.]